MFLKTEAEREDKERYSGKQKEKVNSDEVLISCMYSLVALTLMYLIYPAGLFNFN